LGDSPRRNSPLNTDAYTKKKPLNKAPRGIMKSDRGHKGQIHHPGIFRFAIAEGEGMQELRLVELNGVKERPKIKGKRSRSIIEDRRHRGYIRNVELGGRKDKTQRQKGTMRGK